MRAARGINDRPVHRLWREYSDRFEAKADLWLDNVGGGPVPLSL